MNIKRYNELGQYLKMRLLSTAAIGIMVPMLVFGLSIGIMHEQTIIEMCPRVLDFNNIFLEQIAYGQFEEQIIKGILSSSLAREI